MIVTNAIAQRAIDTKTKPLGALGHLEACAVQLAELQQTLTPVLDMVRVCVFAADHGVANDGVSAYPRAVTAEMMKNFSAGGAAINVIGKTNGVEVQVIDVGVDANLSQLSNIHHAKVCLGTRNFQNEPAMSHDELERALAVGATVVQCAVRDGVRALGLGEMGIGNTTAAAALLSAIADIGPQATVGSGTGVSPEGMRLKREVVSRAISLHGSRSTGVSARECLRRMGGLELAAIAGAVLEALNHPVAIVADGFISTVAILCAGLMAADSIPNGRAALGERLFIAHRSTEPGHVAALESLAKLVGRPQRPLLDLQMRLGEGSGAALAVPILRAAAAIMADMATFESAGVSDGARAEHRT